MNCSNCGTPVDETEEGTIIVHDGGKPIAAVCGSCTDGALVVKVSLRRDKGNEEFKYDQYTALEMEKKAAIGRR